MANDLTIQCREKFETWMMKTHPNYFANENNWDHNRWERWSVEWTVWQAAWEHASEYSEDTK